MKKIGFLCLLICLAHVSISQNPYLLKDVYPGSNGSGITEIVKTSNYTFFNALDGSSADRGLFRTDGTTAGTLKLNLTYPGYSSTKAEKITALGNKVVFTGNNTNMYGEVWVSDGTQEGTIALERFQPTSFASNTNRRVVMDLAAHNNFVLYGVKNTDNHLQLKKTNGTPGAMEVIKDFGAFASVNASLALFKNINGILYFNVYDGVNNDQLWRSDGTVAGTYLVKDFTAARYVASYFMQAGSFFYILLPEFGVGNVLWKSDGTTLGTVPVKLIGASGNNNYPAHAAIGNTLYFSGLDGNGMELWKTDGTEAGTVMVENINPGAAGSAPLNFSILNNELYFTATTLAEGTELRKFNGTSVTLVKDINPGAANGYAEIAGPVSKVVVSNGTLLFSANDNASGIELWMSDGTPANTHMVRDINAVGSSSPSFLTAVNNNLYFSASNGVSGMELFKYDNSDGIGGLNKIYVNDNSTTGDVYTLAVGSDFNPGTRAAPVATITHALSIAQEGDTIKVDAGTYVEDVVINKTVYLAGAKAGQDPGTSLDRSGETVIMPATASVGLNGAIIRPNAANITIDGLLLDGDNPDIPGGTNLNGADVNAGTGIYNASILASNLTVQNCIIKNVGTYGIGLFKNFGFNTGTSIAGTLFTRNHIDNCGSRALVLGYDAYGSITGNLVTRSWNGVWVSQHNQSAPAPVVIGGNKIEAYLLGVQSSGINNSTPSIHYLSNEISQADVLSWVAPNANPNTALTAVSFLLNNTAGVQFNNNKISNASTGLYINNNNSSLISIQNNSFEGNFNEYINALGVATVSANCNWYGTTDADVIQSKIIGNVNYAPWLSSGIDSEVAVGFQPAQGTCNGVRKSWYVNDNDQTGDIFTTAGGNDAGNGSKAAPFLTFNAAYLVAQAGDSIFMDAGSYDFATIRFGLTKSLTIRGTNYELSPNDATNKLFASNNRFTETVVFNGGFRIEAHHITIEGLTLEPGNLSGLLLNNNASTLNNAGNFSFRKNRYIINHTLASLQSFSINGVNGAAGAPVQNSNYAITDNRFIKSGLAIGGTLAFNYCKNVSIINNAFVIEGTPSRVQQAITFGSGGFTDSIVVTGNVINEASTAISGNRLANGIIQYNKIFNVSNAYFSNNPLSESTHIVFSNNELHNDLGTPFMLYTRSGNSPAGNTNIFKVEHNIVSGISEASVNQLFGLLNATINNTVASSEIHFNGNRINYSGNFSSIAEDFLRPVTIRGNLKTVIVNGNDITLENSGTIVRRAQNSTLPGSPAITIGTDNNSNSFMSPGASISLNNNKVAGYLHSIVFWDAAPAGANTYVGYGGLPVGTNVQVHNNSFTGDSLSVANGSTGEMVNATCNWLGTTINTEEKIIGNIQYSPWLSNGADASSEMGFQPIPGSCNGSSLIATVTAVTNVSCNGLSDGSIEIDVTGLYVGPLSYSWTKENSSFTAATEDLAGISAGVYNLVVADAVGTTATQTVTITEPTLITTSVSGTNITCNGSANGTATADATGGTLPYSYLWSNGATTSSISNIAAGIYTVIVTDANGCISNGSYTVTQPSAIAATSTIVNATCFGSTTGSITVNATGGTAPYTFSVNGGNYQNNNVFTGLIQGSYSIAVKDANDCVLNSNATVTSPAQLVITTDNVNNTCPGQANGAISITVTGGTRYNYSWSGPNGYTSTREDITALADGTYTVVVTNTNGCTNSATYIVASANSIILTGEVVPVSCFGTLTGGVDLTVTGGSGTGFTYSWSGPNGFRATTQNIANVKAATYTVTVTDVTGCSQVQSFTVTQPLAALTISAVKTDINNCGGTGGITANANGGTSPYQFKVNGIDQPSGNITGLSAGTYTVSIVDENGCVASTSVTIVDNGSDPYEVNGKLVDAAPISVNQAINARIAPTSNDKDWFKFTTGPVGAMHTLSLVHNSISYAFNLYDSRAKVIAASSQTATSKTYNALAPNTTYYVQVSGALSYVCYELVISTPSSLVSGKAGMVTEPEVVTPEKSLSANVFPNPHSGIFQMQVKSPVNGIAIVELFTAEGKILESRKVNLLNKGTNSILYNNIPRGAVFYRVQVGNKVIRGQVVGL